MNKEIVIYVVEIKLINAHILVVDIVLFEEVEAFTGVRPVLICGVLANQITNLLVESYPKLFHYYHPGNVLQCKIQSYSK